MNYNLIRHFALVGIIGLFLANHSFAQRADTLLLYPAGIPNSKLTPSTYIENAERLGFTRNVSVPQLIAYQPLKPNGTAVIICPGGGYMGLGMLTEGRDIALRFNQLGVTAFVVKYRLPLDDIMADKTIGPLQDVQRAFQIVRQGASKWNLDPAKVGVMGFSAGGHLASTAGTHYNKAVIANPDNTNLRPDFMILIYPVISFGPLGHQGSRENLIGKNALQQLVDLYSNEKQVTADTPPTFLLHTQDDDVVPVQNSLLFYDALIAKKVKTEMHLLQAGGHGFSLYNTREPVDWFTYLNDWMKVNGWER